MKEVKYSVQFPNFRKPNLASPECKAGIRIFTQMSELKCSQGACAELLFCLCCDVTHQVVKIMENF